MNHSEYHLQKSICQYLRAQYPKVMFLSDTVANVSLTIPQQVRNKAIQNSDFKCPDLLIFKPKFIFYDDPTYYHGLFLELKTESPFRKDGKIKASQNDHLKLQQETLFKLSLLGYKAEFAWSFDMAINIINEYLK